MYPNQVPGWDPRDEPSSYHRGYEGTISPGFGGIRSDQFATDYEYQNALRNQAQVEADRDYSITYLPEEDDDNYDESVYDRELKEQDEDQEAASHRLHGQFRKILQNGDRSGKLPVGADIVVDDSQKMCPAEPQAEFYKNDDATNKANLECWLMNVAAGRVGLDRYDFSWDSAASKARNTNVYVYGLYLRLANGVKAMRILHRMSILSLDEAALSIDERVVLDIAREDLGDELVLDAAVVWSSIAGSEPPRESAYEWARYISPGKRYGLPSFLWDQL